MIRSLRDRLRELEQAEQQHITGNQSNTTNTSDKHLGHADAQSRGENNCTVATPAPSQAVGSVTDVSISRDAPPPSAPPVPGLEPPTRARNEEGAITASPASTRGSNPSTSSDVGQPLQVDVATTSAAPLIGLRTPSGSSPEIPRRLEPISVERLMRPIDRAINQVMADSPRVSQTGGVDLNATSQCSCDRLFGPGTWSLPLRRHADDLVRLYFFRVHRMYPILHEPTFRRLYQQLWEPALNGPAHCLGLCRQKGLDKTFPAILNAVFALASLFASNPPEQNSAQAGTFFNMTQKLDLLDIIDDEIGIELVQLLLLMGFYLQSTERFSKSWNITGLAIRMAQNMGLQLSPNDARKKGLVTSCPTQLELEMRIRVWYGCVLLDREISMSFGRPSMINAHSTGEQLRLPEAIDDEFLNDEGIGKRHSQPNNYPSLLESYIQTIKLYNILGQVLDREEPSDTPPSANPDTRSLLDLDTAVMDWRDSLPAHLQYDPSSPENQQVCAPRRGSLSTADFSAQARRLHARFLHVRTLILRPALEFLFQKQRYLQPDSGSRSTPKVARVQDLVLVEIAAQCVLSADSLVRYLDTHIRAQSLVAWWYNISCKLPPGDLMKLFIGH
ncbi:hypothetical protein VTI28DRAFT_4094 [Corynascus sepedonium]